MFKSRISWENGLYRPKSKGNQLDRHRVTNGTTGRRNSRLIWEINTRICLQTKIWDPILNRVKFLTKITLVTQESSNEREF